MTYREVLENFLKFGLYKSGELYAGIGADDRAGCAILWLLKDLGHSLLITNGEEFGSIGSQVIKHYYKDLFEELNNHQYMIEFDRGNSHDYKVYYIPVTEEFKHFIEKNTGYKEADKYSSTDITVLYEKICGVNLSIGYYCEHTELDIFLSRRNPANNLYNECDRIAEQCNKKPY